jgi:hypothetical protein
MRCLPAELREQIEKDAMRFAIKMALGPACALAGLAQYEVDNAHVNAIWKAYDQQRQAGATSRL